MKNYYVVAADLPERNAFITTSLDYAEKIHARLTKMYNKYEEKETGINPAYLTYKKARKRWGEDAGDCETFLLGSDVIFCCKFNNFDLALACVSEYLEEKD